MLYTNIIYNILNPFIFIKYKNIKRKRYLPSITASTAPPAQNSIRICGKIKNKCLTQHWVWVFFLKFNKKDKEIAIK